MGRGVALDILGRIERNAAGHIPCAVFGDLQDDLFPFNRGSLHDITNIRDIVGVRIADIHDRPLDGNDMSIYSLHDHFLLK